MIFTRPLPKNPEKLLEWSFAINLNLLRSHQHDSFLKFDSLKTGFCQISKNAFK